MTVAGNDCNNNLVQFLTPNGNTAKHKLTAEQKELLETTDNEWDIMLMYVSKAECDEWDDGTTPGWYFTKDEIMLYNISENGLINDETKENEVDVSFGKGFFFKNAGDENKLLWSGAVIEDNSEVSVNKGGFSIVGNASPIDRDLGYFSVLGNDCNNNLLQFLTPNGNTDKYEFSDEEKEILETTDKSWDKMLMYVSKAECDEWDDGTTPGWYFTKDEVMLLNMNEKITVKAGEGFFFKPAYDENKLIIPGAFPEAE